jgi:ppGpp synthetase/RelA/SpoT-type nucleotidyltranferase
MMEDRVAIGKEVSDFLAINRERYIRVLKEFRDVFISYQRSAEGKQVLYRVASRGDYQDGDEVKKINRLVDKIEDKRGPLFSWDDVPNDRSEELIRFPEILRFLRDEDIDWAESAKICKSSDGKTICIFKDENSAEIMIAEKNKATLKISGGRTYLKIRKDLKVKKVNGKLNIYKPENDPDYTIDKVKDIIGLRLIYIHPSDIEVLKGYILKSDKINVSLDDIEPHNDKSGYRALHMTATLLGGPELRDIKCEIQIITMLQEAWGFKTHGPIYEEREDLESEYMVHAKFLSEYLHIVDNQTEFLIEEIQRKRALESQRRTALIKQHLLILLPKAVKADNKIMATYKSNGIDFKNIEDPVIALSLIINLIKERFSDKKIEEINRVREILTDKSKYQEIIGDLDFIMGEIKEYEKIYQIFDKKDNFSLCISLIHIIVLIEALDITRKFRNESLNHVERLLRYCEDNSENKVKATLYKALILYFNNDFETAARAAKKALNLANRLNNLELICDAKNSYSYFSSEWIDNSRKEIKTEEVEKIKEEVLGYLNEAFEDAPDSEKRNKYKDSLGFAYIVFGSNEDEIWKGIKICKETVKAEETVKPEETELLRIYYNKHVRRAYERILDLI